MKTNSILLEKGISTILTRNSDVFVDLMDRVDLATKSF